MSEYWTPLERLLAQDSAVVDPVTEIPRMLVEQHFVAPENEQAARELLAEHSSTYVEDPDDEYDYYCQCGKWLERDQYELPDHQSAVLDDAGLILREEGPQRPPLVMPNPAPAAFAFQFPRRVVRFTPSGLDEFHPDFPQPRGDSVSTPLFVALSVMNCVSIALGIVVAYPRWREEHQARQRSRLEYDGWTTPWWWGWVWWVGLERTTPRFLRQTEGQR